MTLNESHYARLLPFRATIRHVASGGSTSKPDAWIMCNQIKYELTGGWSRSDCDACKAELLQEFEMALTEYEHGNEKR